MTDGDQTLYLLLCELAERNAAVPTNEELIFTVGCESSSTPPVMLRRLERAGLITVRRWQQHRQVTIVATGKSTRAPVGRAGAPNAQPRRHWRDARLGLEAPIPVMA